MGSKPPSRILPGNANPHAGGLAASAGSSMSYAREDHVHPEAPALSGFQSERLLVTATGLYTWTYPTPFGAGVVPNIMAVAEGPNPAGGTLINVQIEGVPTNTSATFRVNKTNQSVVALLGLTILSVPASLGTNYIHAWAKAP